MSKYAKILKDLNYLISKTKSSIFTHRETRKTFFTHTKSTLSKIDFRAGLKRRFFTEGLSVGKAEKLAGSISDDVKYGRGGLDLLKKMRKKMGKTALAEKKHGLTSLYSEINKYPMGDEFLKSAKQAVKGSLPDRMINAREKGIVFRRVGGRIVPMRVKK